MTWIIEVAEVQEIGFKSLGYIKFSGSNKLVEFFSDARRFGNFEEVRLHVLELTEEFQGTKKVARVRKLKRITTWEAGDWLHWDKLSRR